MFALQVTFFSLLTLLLVAPLTSRWLHPVHCQPGQGAQDHLGRGAQGQHWQGAQDHLGKGTAGKTNPLEEEVRRWKMLAKSIWMKTFDKIHAEITERLKTKEEKNPGDLRRLEELAAAIDQGSTIVYYQVPALLVSLFHCNLFQFLTKHCILFQKNAEREEDASGKNVQRNLEENHHKEQICQNASIKTCYH